MHSTGVPGSLAYVIERRPSRLNNILAGIALRRSIIQVAISVWYTFVCG